MYFHFLLVNIYLVMMEINMKLGQIADAAGYSDPKYMSRIFREEVGMLPLEYRKMHL